MIPARLLPYYYSGLVILCILAVVAVGWYADRKTRKGGRK